MHLTFVNILIWILISFLHEYSKYSRLILEKQSWQVKAAGQAEGYRAGWWSGGRCCWARGSWWELAEPGARQTLWTPVACSLDIRNSSVCPRLYGSYGLFGRALSLYSDRKWEKMQVETYVWDRSTWWTRVCLFESMYMCVYVQSVWKCVQACVSVSKCACV